MQWPFTVGTGTLGCVGNAVVFRTGGYTYALNDAAKSKYASDEPIRQVQGSGSPRDPLKRLKQDERMQIFRASLACEDRTDTALCKQRLRVSRALSEGDLTQIEAEGRERFWPPLPARRMSVEPLIKEGLRLCAG